MNMLHQRRTSKRNPNSFQASSLVIDLEDEIQVNTVHFSNIVQDDPDIIVLDDSTVQTKRRSICNSVVDLTDFNETLKDPEERTEEDSDIIVVYKKKTFVPETRQSTREVELLNNSPMNHRINQKLDKNNVLPVNYGINKRHDKNIFMTVNQRINQRCDKNSFSPVNHTINKRHDKNSFSPVNLRINHGQDKTNVKTKKRGRSSCTKLKSPINSLSGKKRKLQDISNINLGASGNTAPTDLSENAHKYYKKLAQLAVKDCKKNKSSNDFIPVVNNLNRARKSISFAKNSKKIMKKQVQSGNKSSQSSPGRKLRKKTRQQRISKISEKNAFKKSQIQSGNKSLRKLRKMTRQETISKISEMNAFNPNPYEVDLEGLRPIVIDGCNVAIGHGKGKFSPNGLKICVDYFAARGHTNIKIFMPLFRQEQFSSELLTELKTKCDVVFTPSQCINGQRRTPYDDRFIVQYATEFGGVIVSTDNYRDISTENVRWRDTIAKRLLMFTWVDDFLMFPVDPLGRSGPTLEEFLRF